MNLFPSLRGYRASWLTGDLTSGVMLAAIAIPEQLATARLAGFPPEAGLYAFMAGAIAFALLGSNPYISVGGDSTIAPIFAGSLTALVGAGSVEYAPLAGALALAVGVVLIAVGVLRAGWIADLLSVPVTVGFLAGIAVHIIAGQLPDLLGVPDADGPLVARIWNVLLHVPQTNPLDLAVGVTVLAVTLGAARINKRIPGALIAMVGVAFASSAWSFDRHGVRMLGALQARLPSVHIPPVPSASHLVALVPLTLVVAAVCILQTSAVGRSFPTTPGEEENSSQDFLAVGAGSVLAGLAGAFPVDSSPPRTEIVKDSGGASQVAAVVAVTAIVGVLLFASHLLAYVPQAALAGVLCFIALHLLRFGDMKKIARYSRREFVLMIVGALLVIVLPIQTGMLLAIMLSLAHGVQLMMWPQTAVFVNQPHTTIWWTQSEVPGGIEVPGVVVFAPEAPINFTNAEYIRQRLLAAVAGREPVHLVVIEASGVTDIDYTGSQSIQKTIEELRARDVNVAIARLIVTHAQEAARRSGLLDVVGAGHVFKSVADAINALDGPKG